MSNTEKQRSAICRAITSFGHSISADKVILHRDNGEKDNLLTLIIDAVEKELDALSAQSAVQEPLHCFPILSEEMRKVLRNENCVYQSEDEIYKALCAAASTSQPSFQSAAQVEEIRNAALEEVAKEEEAWDDIVRGLLKTPSTEIAEPAVTRTCEAAAMSDERIAELWDESRAGIPRYATFARLVEAAALSASAGEADKRLQWMEDHADIWLRDPVVSHMVVKDMSLSELVEQAIKHNERATNSMQSTKEEK